MKTASCLVRGLTSTSIDRLGAPASPVPIVSRSGLIRLPWSMTDVYFGKRGALARRSKPRCPAWTSGPESQLNESVHNRGLQRHAPVSAHRRCTGRSRSCRRGSRWRRRRRPARHYDLVEIKVAIRANGLRPLSARRGRRLAPRPERPHQRVRDRCLTASRSFSSPGYRRPHRVVTCAFTGPSRAQPVRSPYQSRTFSRGRIAELRGAAEPSEHAPSFRHPQVPTTP